MAEVLGLMASITSLIDITGQAMRLCCDYIGSVRGAPADIRDIKNQVSVFQTEVQALQCFLTTHPEDASFIQDLAKPDGVLSRSYDTIQKLLDLLGPGTTDGGLDRSPRTLRFGMTRLSLDDLKWPRKERKARELLTELESFKNTLTLALSTGLAKDMQVVKAGIQNLQDEIRETNASLDGMERRSILKWLCPDSDGIRNMHGEKRELQEPNTCSWMTREDAWKQWLNGHNMLGEYRRFIWIHGIPGAGKTVLASYLIEEAANFCHSHGYAYYYCLYSRGQDETAPLLKWVLNLLSRQAGRLVPTKLHAAYQAERALSIRDLLDCLEEISHQFTRVYIIVDAVDESQPRDLLLKTLSEIGTSERFSNVSLLFTSRKENDIMETIHGVQDFCFEISMSNKNVRDDIKSFIHAQLKKGTAWRRWDDAFLNEIEDRLVQEARGMFRWAVCQLDVLKQQRTKEGILEALRTLPADIFATYERILTNIPKRDREFARTALALICSDTSEIPTAEILVAACLYNVPFGDIGNYTVATLHEICGCLIHLSKLRNTPASHFNRGNEEKDFHQVTLAHYTVKEYLFFPGTAQGPAKFFALSDEIVRHIDLTVIFNGLRHFGLRRMDAGNGPVSRYEEYCLEMTNNALGSRRTDILREEGLRRVVLDSLAPEFQHLAYLRQQRGFTLIMRNSFPRWSKLLACEIWPVSKITGTLTNLVILNWISLAEKYLESTGIKEMRRAEAIQVWTQRFKLKNEEEGTLLSFCVRRRLQEFLKLFVRFGATFDCESQILYTTMSVFYNHDVNGSKTNAVLKLLLGACANPNPVPNQPINPRGSPSKFQVRSGFAFTPLQLAVRNLEQDWVETLLEEGADANRIGSRSGDLPSAFDENNNDLEDTKEIRAMGQQTPLEICATTEPPWAHNANREHVRRARQAIEVLLKRYGARQNNRVDDDKIIVDLVSVTEDDSAAEENNIMTLVAAQTTDPNLWRQY
ncbi:hypothetical protein F5X99DRAFT_386226 [Biscogniauxia marginata]|nr:hypothetical protein F5X99DRAFT_386226 [Biscogniauxia marginata]